MKDITVDDLITLYNMEAHPEGGYFKETYRAKGTIPSDVLPKYEGERNYSTGIYFLLPEGSRSVLHRLKSDEIWHFYLGCPLTLVQISPKGQVEEIIMGNDIKSGQKVQHTIPAGYFFGAYPNKGSDFSFLGCTVSPGFDFADFEMADREELVRKYPDAKDIIECLTK